MPAAVAGARPACRLRRRPSATRPFEQVNLVLGVNGLTRTDDAPLRPRRAQRRARRRHLVAGCSRRSASAAAWPTRSTPSPATTPTPAWSASRSAACPPSSTRCSPTVRAELAKVAADGHHRRGAGPRQGPAARRPGARPRGLRLPDVAARQGRAGPRRAARRIDEVLARIDAVTLDDVREARGPAVRPARDPGRRSEPDRGQLSAGR